MSNGANDYGYVMDDNSDLKAMVKKRIMMRWALTYFLILFVVTIALFYYIQEADGLLLGEHTNVAIGIFSFIIVSMTILVMIGETLMIRKFQTAIKQLDRNQAFFASVSEQMRKKSQLDVSS